jgi:uncharacterized protein YdaU (DUF1376 family)
VRSPAEDASKLSEALGELAKRLSAIDGGQAIFTREDVDRIVSDRLAREQKRTRKAEREAAELRARLERMRMGEAGEHKDWLGGLLGELDSSSQTSEERS